MATSTLRLAKAFHQPILDHYHLAAPLLDGLFEGTPLLYAAYPRGLGNSGSFTGRCKHRRRPVSVRSM